MERGSSLVGKKGRIRRKEEGVGGGEGERGEVEEAKD